MTQDTSIYYVWIGGSCDYGQMFRGDFRSLRISGYSRCPSTTLNQINKVKDRLQAYCLKSVGFAILEIACVWVCTYSVSLQRCCFEHFLLREFKVEDIEVFLDSA